MMRRLHKPELREPRRRGAATLDYILVLGIVLPLLTVVMPTGMRIIRAVTEMITVFIAWPFM